MSNDIPEEQWKQFIGKANEYWDEINEDELIKTQGKRDRIVILIQEKCVLTQKEAESQLDDFLEQWERD